MKSKYARPSAFPVGPALWFISMHVVSACTGERLSRDSLQTHADTATAAIDADADGFPATKDCDDYNSQASPARLERCNGIDDDCDGVVDESDAVDASNWYTDNDGDGYGDPNSATVTCEAPAGQVPDGSDCDDSDATTNPGGVEPDTFDEVDNDCDGYDEVTYDAALDFSATENPNGAWVYGYCEFALCVVSLFATTGNLGLAGMAFWLYDTSDSTSLKVGMNTTSSETVGPVIYPAYGLILHPGSGPPIAVVQWTAPRAGTCLVHAEFTRLDAVTAGVSVWHTSSGTEPVALLDTELLATSECDGDELIVQTLEEQEVDVELGDTIDARVSWGCDGNVGSDTVGLSMSISCAFPS